MSRARDSGSVEYFFNSQSLREDQLFQDMLPEAVKAFEAMKQIVLYPEGSMIFAEGQRPRGVYLLSQGRANLVMRPKGKRARIIRIAEQGEMLGLSATISGEPYEVTAETLTPCQVGFIKRDDFLSLLREQPETCFRVAQLLGQSIHESYERFPLFDKTLPASAKLAHLILSWCAGGEETDEGIRLRLPLTHEQIARMIGTSRETVTRAFGEFRRKQIIQLEGATLLILNLAELESVAKSCQRSQKLSCLRNF